MEHSIEELHAAVRTRVCRVCDDLSADGQCALQDPSNCALFRLFPQIVQAIDPVSGDRQQCIEAIRRDVCPVCADRASGDSCELREQARCRLDTFLLPVIDTVHEVIGKTFDRSRMQPAGGPTGIRPNPQLSL